MANNNMGSPKEIHTDKIKREAIKIHLKSRERLSVLVSQILTAS
jgi:hypothetical protein